MKKIIIGVLVFVLLATNAVYAERRTMDDKYSDIASSTRSEKRDKERNASSTRSELKNKNTSSTVDASCVSTAVSVREGAIFSSWTTFNGKIEGVLNERKADLINAWTLTDSKERKSELKKIWETSKKEKKVAGNEYKNSKKTIWAEYKKAVKACGGNVGDEASGESEPGEKIEV